MIKISERAWKTICRLAAQLDDQPNYAAAKELYNLLHAVERAQPLRAKNSGAGGITIHDIATGKPVPASHLEMPLDDLHLGDD